jgi:hypothetical protein
VPEEKLKGFVEVVNRYPGVTHNYLRNHEYNVWFTFIAPSMRLLSALPEISEITGVKEVLSLPARRRCLRSRWILKCDKFSSSVLVQEAIQFFLRHLSHLHEEFPDPVFPQLVDAENGFFGFPLGAENGVFQGEIGLLEKLDFGADKDDVMAEKKVKSAPTIPQMTNFLSLLCMGQGTFGRPLPPRGRKRFNSRTIFMTLKHIKEEPESQGRIEWR